ncbi:hypothetical protein TTRE_0000378101 [Trichuris trichiura]|uniref:WW domain-containing protein n=1 Tax=Trichuris trichiura TaxID=36087 RepID=A0A077Z6Q3_TRITR|nr:hypothetical protein TTRE_0000378101 [Trichuris trichiura]
MALYGEYPQGGGGGGGDSQVPIVQHQRSRSNVVIRSNVDLDQALNDHFRKSIECLGSPSVARSGHNLSVASSWREKNLPDTFFKPSKQGSHSPVAHSRVGSDSSGCHTVSSPCSVLSACATGPPSRGNATANANAAAGLGPNVQHARAHSSPATLQNGQLTFASSYGVQHSATISYGRDRNFEIDADEAPLPPGWEMGCAENGQPYFIK